jgi:hypothetical protein
MNFCEPEVEDYTIVNCGIDYAGVVGIGLINLYENPTNEELESQEFWTDKIIESDTKYFAIRNTRGEYNGGDPVEEEDLIGTRVVDANHVLTFESTAIIENWKYWNYVQKHFWKLCIVNSSGLLFYVDKPVSIYTKVNNQRSTKQQAFYQSEMKWLDLSNPVILNAPPRIFFGNNPILIGEGFDYNFNFSFA